MFVGDDSITRAVAEVRRIARETGSGFGIETIPRIGYRLTGGAATSTRLLAEPEPVPAAIAATPEPVDSIPMKATRRWIIGGALAATGAVAFGVWTVFRPRPDPRYLELLDRGKQALRTGLPDSNQQGVEIFQEAVAIRPDDAAAWGLLALAKNRVADRSPSRSAGSIFQESEQAARRALALDEREPNALVVLAMLQRNLDDWLTTERKLRAALAIAPDNAAALDSLVALLQASGYLQDSWDLNERAVALDPLRPGPQFRRALKHWIMGRSREADHVIARARELVDRVSYTQRDLLSIAALSADLNVDGHRADLVVLKTARANAAFENRLAISDRDIAMAAELAYPHRIRRGPFHQTEITMEQLQDRIEQLHGQSESLNSEEETTPAEETQEAKKKGAPERRS